MSRARLLIAAALIAASLAPVAGQAACVVPGNSPNGCLVHTGDRNVVLAGNSVLPSTIDIAYGGRAIFQNLDPVRHTVTFESPACRATPVTNGCGEMFDFVMQPFAAGMTAGTIFTGQGFVPRGWYPFFCKVHSPAPGVGMTGVLIVR